MQREDPALWFVAIKQYYAFVTECDRSETVRTWTTFKILVQYQVPISPLELRFYFQQGLRMEIGKQLREHHPPNLDETIQLALRFDHGLYKQQQSSDWEKTATCYRCKVMGHIVPNCPTLKP
ncbi:Hypothetical protein PHPALM_1060 [Phytophthora palmivora]|uniref:CCHC-type domain-containing protein n=1 Tax=Phytophthora palmivora TaxID=4796 RepID=A0A2P4YTA6_9STRA|nr:Hypothetical protein PHPALM_1060 [Phytophthora palmivora]